VVVEVKAEEIDMEPPTIINRFEYPECPVGAFSSGRNNGRKRDFLFE